MKSQEISREQARLEHEQTDRAWAVGFVGGKATTKAAAEVRIDLTATHTHSGNLQRTVSGENSSIIRHCTRQRTELAALLNRGFALPG